MHRGEISGSAAATTLNRPAFLFSLSFFFFGRKIRLISPPAISPLFPSAIVPALAQLGIIQLSS
jgi:hypothetical protein